MRQAFRFQCVRPDALAFQSSQTQIFALSSEKSCPIGSWQPESAIITIPKTADHTKPMQLILSALSLCSFLMEYDIHTILDGLTLAATVWVIYELRGPLKGTYQADQDIVQTWMVVSIA